MTSVARLRRCLEIARLLAQETLLRSELAARLAVSERQVQRELALLKEAGYPVKHTSKGYRLATNEELAVMAEAGAKIQRRTQMIRSRARIFRRIKSQHQDWTRDAVATAAMETTEWQELGLGRATSVTVTADYRAMGWHWKRGKIIDVSDESSIGFVKCEAPHIGGAIIQH